MSHPRNQHIVPEFLLKNFSDDGLKIWSFDKASISEVWSEVKKRSISNTPTKEFFYDKSAGEKADSLEYKLREIENDASLKISEILEKGELKFLSYEDKKSIALFLATQSLRTVSSMDEFGKLYERLNNFIAPHKHSFDIDSADPRLAWLELINDADYFVKSFINKSWNLIISDEKYFLSDNPFVKYNAIKRPYRGNLGYESLGIELYLPVSSSVMLSISCKETFKLDKKVLKALPENIEFMNWLQVKYSDRFIFSKNNDFELIYDMLEKNEL